MAIETIYVKLKKNIENSASRHMFSEGHVWNSWYEVYVGKEKYLIYIKSNNEKFENVWMNLFEKYVVSTILNGMIGLKYISPNQTFLSKSIQNPKKLN